MPSQIFFFVNLSTLREARRSLHLNRDARHECKGRGEQASPPRETPGRRLPSSARGCPRRSEVPITKLSFVKYRYRVVAFMAALALSQCTSMRVAAGVRRPPAPRRRITVVMRADRDSLRDGKKGLPLPITQPQNNMWNSTVPLRKSTPEEENCDPTAEDPTADTCTVRGCCCCCCCFCTHGWGCGRCRRRRNCFLRGWRRRRRCDV
jgi:hypothetical protein